MKSCLLNNKNTITDRAREMYNDFPFGNFSYGKKREKYESLLFKLLRESGKKHKLFDIGCGAGYWLNVYIREGIPKENITAVDLAPNNIENLKKKGFNAVCASVLCLPFENNVSDLTVCNGVIHHTEDPLKAFSELVRITKSGGYIYLKVYNIWNPYFYIVHRAMLPVRYFYWHISKKIFDWVYPLSAILFQPLALLAFGEFLDNETGKAILMDQVFTPRADLFSKGKILSYAKKYNCEVIEFEYDRCFIMIGAVIKVKG